MQKASDGMVTAADLVQAIEEIRRGYGEATMARLFKSEPHLAIYVESIAAHLTNQPKGQKYNPDAMADALDRILVVVRAMEIGQHRLWRGSVDPSSPLGRMIGPAGGPSDGQKK